jgi:hypothetical protein
MKLDELTDDPSAFGSSAVCRAFVVVNSPTSRRRARTRALWPGFRRVYLGTAQWDIDADRRNSPKADMAPPKVISSCDIVFEVEPAGGTLESTGAAAGHDRVLAASPDL